MRTPSGTWVVPVPVVGFLDVFTFFQGAVLALPQVADHGLGHSDSLLVAGL